MGWGRCVGLNYGLGLSGVISMSDFLGRCVMGRQLDMSACLKEVQ